MATDIIIKHVQSCEIAIGTITIACSINLKGTGLPKLQIYLLVK